MRCANWGCTAGLTQRDRQLFPITRGPIWNQSGLRNRSLGETLSTQVEAMQAQGEHANSAKKGPAGLWIHWPATVISNVTFFLWGDNINYLKKMLILSILQHKWKCLVNWFQCLYYLLISMIISITTDIQKKARLLKSWTKPYIIATYCKIIKRESNTLI